MAATKTGKGLGKGLGALLSTDGIPENTGDSVVELKINDISPNEDQPRKNFDEEALKELADSIRENGIIQPIIVQKKGIREKSIMRMKWQGKKCKIFGTFKIQCIPIIQPKKILKC